MKKLEKFFLFTFIFTSILLSSCSKEKGGSPTVSNELNVLKKGFEFSWSVTFSAGHQGQQCGWACWNYGAPGQVNPGHMPCWSFGNSCSHTVNISISLKKQTFDLIQNLDKPFDAKIDLVNESADVHFPFPSRSFSYVLEGVTYWLNIPEQTATAIDQTNTSFLLKNVYFSNIQAYQNE